MDLKIIKIADFGKENARIVIEAIGKGDIGEYLLFHVSKEEEAVSPQRLRKIFVFPQRMVDKGDYVSVFLGQGTNRDFPNRRKTTTYAFYWDLGDFEIGDKFFLLHYDSWESESIQNE